MNEPRIEWTSTRVLGVWKPRMKMQWKATGSVRARRAAQTSGGSVHDGGGIGRTRWSFPKMRAPVETWTIASTIAPRGEPRLGGDRRREDRREDVGVGRRDAREHAARRRTPYDRPVSSDERRVPASRRRADPAASSSSPGPRSRSRYCIRPSRALPRRGGQGRARRPLQRRDDLLDDLRRLPRRRAARAADRTEAGGRRHPARRGEGADRQRRGLDARRTRQGKQEADVLAYLATLIKPPAG